MCTYLIIAKMNFGWGTTKFSFFGKELHCHMNAYLVCPADEVKIMSIKKLANYICTKGE
jgi:hypothetical protein